MWWCLVLAVLLTTCAAGFAPAPIRWGGSAARNFVLAPKGSSGPPQSLTIVDTRMGKSSNMVPRFSQTPDNTVIWEGSGWCMEASDDKLGAEVRVNMCTGGPTQRWQFVPDRRLGQEMIKLKDTNKCLHVGSKGGDLNGVPVELRSCDGEVNESWMFERSTFLAGTRWPSGSRALPPSSRNIVTSFASMVALAALSFGVWLRRKQTNVRAMSAEGRGGALRIDEGGVSLSLSLTTKLNTVFLIPESVDLSLRPVPVMMAVRPVSGEEGDAMRDDDKEERGRGADDQNSATPSYFSTLDRQGEAFPFTREACELIPHVTRLEVQEAAEALHKYADALSRQVVPERLRNNVKAFISQATAFAGLAVALTSNAALAADETVVQYGSYAVDKTGIIGGAANLIEMGIDLGHSGLDAAGVANTYGISICLFTVLIKTLTFPLVKNQIESAAKLQKLAPLAEKIKNAYPSEADQQKRANSMLELYQTANVNPLDSILPTFVQIPVLISFYRALQNLVAENKLTEPFLWLPSLEGPIYDSPRDQSLEWFTSIFSGNPKLGWEDTGAFLALPAALWIAQSISQRILRPPQDPSRLITPSESLTNGIVDTLPLVVAFFSLNNPAGLGIYWLSSNFLTTITTLLIRANMKDDGVNLEALVDRQISVTPGELREKGSATFADPTRPTLHESCKKGDMNEIVKELSAQNLNVFDFWGISPLGYAISGNQMAATQMLLERKANSQAVDSVGNSGLHYAAGSGYTDLVELLLKSGANANHRNQNGQTPLEAARENKHTEAEQALVEAGASAAFTVKIKKPQNP